MGTSSPQSDAERELYELRRRAYGPHHDIENDPAALARLTELETVRTKKKLPKGAAAEIDEPEAAEGAPTADFAWTTVEADRENAAAQVAPAVSDEGSLPSLWRRITATLARRGWLVVGVLMTALTVIFTVELLRPHPDARLDQIADEGDVAVFMMLEVLGADVDRSSMRGYEPYRGLEPWFAVDRQGLQCFMIIDRSGPTVDGANCVPPGVDLFADIGRWPQLEARSMEGLPDGTIIRFHYRGNSVDASLYPATEN